MQHESGQQTWTAAFAIYMQNAKRWHASEAVRTGKQN